MTDLLDTPAIEVMTTGVGPSFVDAERPLQWAPHEPAPKKQRRGLWIGLGAGVLLLGAGVTSFFLIAPGTTVAGVSVGWMTPGAAAAAIAEHVTDVKVSFGDSDVTLSGADLGASIDAEVVANAVFEAHPLWNVTAWNAEPVPADIALDSAKAEAALREAIPEGFVTPTDATVAFDAGSNSYITTPAVAGSGIDIDALATDFQGAVSEGKSTVDFSADPTETPAAISDETAANTAGSLNAMISNAGFYVGEERTVPIDAPTLASWLTVTPGDGAFQISADAAAIQPMVDTLAGAINRAPVNAKAIVNSSGGVLKELISGVTGRELTDVDSIASSFANQLSEGNAAYGLSVQETAFETTTLHRRIEVNLAQQRTYLYENDQVVNSWAISSGRAGTPSHTGNFTVRAHVRMQDMRGTNADGSKYVTEDVEWVTYYNGDEAFHATYWHSNFGTPMSHGCINMTNGAAQTVYEFAPVGTEVWVH